MKTSEVLPSGLGALMGVVLLAVALAWATGGLTEPWERFTMGNDYCPTVADRASQNREGMPWFLALAECVAPDMPAEVQREIAERAFSVSQEIDRLRRRP